MCDQKKFQTNVLENFIVNKLCARKNCVITFVYELGDLEAMRSRVRAWFTEKWKNFDYALS